MQVRKSWTRNELLVAFSLYCHIPFGKLHSRNPEIIRYAELIGRTPSALAMKLTNIASLDPAIISTGRKGLKAASLADKNMWDEMQNNWDSFVEATNNIMKELSVNSDKNEPFSEQSTDYSGKTKSVQSKVRVGQNFFRKSVLSAYNGKCCITGLSLRNLLVASHIVPWKDDESNRLNPRNGLALSMLHDKAFDLGVITISDDMRVLVSQKYSGKNDFFFESSIWFFNGKKITIPEKFRPREDFLAYHREHVYEKQLGAK